MKNFSILLSLFIFFTGSSVAQNNSVKEREQIAQDEYVQDQELVQTSSIQQQNLIKDLVTTKQSLIQKKSNVNLAVLPEVLYYTFDEAVSPTQNFADPGRGAAFADVLGGLTMGSTGQFGGALIGSGNSSATDYVNTGWIPDIGTSNWTISLYLNNMPAGTTLYYLFGGDVSVAWRCFTGGVAGEYGVMMRHPTGSGTDITVPGVGPGPTVLTFVYDSSVPVIYAYLNGLLTVTQPQAGAINIGGSTIFKVGGYGTAGNSMPPGALMDEFRFYERALDSAEVADTWNISIVPVELTSFTAFATGNNVQLEWTTATELNNSGFSIERKSADTDYMEVGFVPGFGTTSEPKSYSFNDQNLPSGHYSYRLKQIDFDGTFEYSSEVEVDVITPIEFNLAQNYPNPFNPSTSIKYSIPKESIVRLEVLNILGEQVDLLVNETKSEGVYEVVWDASSVSSGTYFYRIQAGDFVQIKKMLLLR